MKVTISVTRPITNGLPKLGQISEIEQTTSFYAPKICLNKNCEYVKFAVSSHFNTQQAQIMFDAQEKGSRCIMATLPLHTTWTVVPTIKPAKYTLLYKVKRDKTAEEEYFDVELRVLPNK
jgi:hypothetical protein